MAGKGEPKISSQVDDIQDRLERNEMRLNRLQNTLQAVMRETSGLSIGGPCSQCDRCFLFLKNGTMYCPECGNGRSV